MKELTKEQVAEAIAYLQERYVHGGPRLEVRIETLDRLATILQYQPDPISEDLVERMIEAALENGAALASGEIGPNARKAMSAAARVALDAALGHLTDEEHAAYQAYADTSRPSIDNFLDNRRRALLAPKVQTDAEKVEAILHNDLGHAGGMHNIPAIAKEIVAALRGEA